MRQDRWWRKLLGVAGSGALKPAPRKQTVLGLEALEQRETPSATPWGALPPMALGNLSFSSAAGPNPTQVQTTGTHQGSLFGHEQIQLFKNGDSHSSDVIVMSMGSQNQLSGWFQGQLPSQGEGPSGLSGLPGMGQLPTPGQNQAPAQGPGQLPGMGSGQLLTVHGQLPGQDPSGQGQLTVMDQLPAPGQGQLSTQGHG